MKRTGITKVIIIPVPARPLPKTLRIDRFEILNCKVNLAQAGTQGLHRPSQHLEDLHPAVLSGL